MQFFTKWCSSPIMACEQLSLSWMLFLYPIMTHTCFQISRLPMECSKQVWNVPNRYGMFQTGMECPKQVFFFGAFLNFLESFFLISVTTFLEPVVGIKFRICIYLHENNKLYPFEREISNSELGLYFDLVPSGPRYRTLKWEKVGK